MSERIVLLEIRPKSIQILEVDSSIQDSKDVLKGCSQQAMVKKYLMIKVMNTSGLLPAELGS